MSAAVFQSVSPLHAPPFCNVTQQTRPPAAPLGKCHSAWGHRSRSPPHTPHEPLSEHADPDSLDANLSFLSASVSLSHMPSSAQTDHVLRCNYLLFPRLCSFPAVTYKDGAPPPTQVPPGLHGSVQSPPGCGVSTRRLGGWRASFAELRRGCAHSSRHLVGLSPLSQ